MNLVVIRFVVVVASLVLHLSSLVQHLYLSKVVLVLVHFHSPASLVFGHKDLVQQIHCTYLEDLYSRHYH